MKVFMKWLAVVILVTGLAGCGSSRIAKIEEQMQAIQSQVDGLSSKVDKLAAMQSDLQKLESRSADQQRRIEGIRDAILSVLQASSEALQNSISKLEAQ